MYLLFSSVSEEHLSTIQQPEIHLIQQETKCQTCEPKSEVGSINLCQKKEVIACSRNRSNLTRPQLDSVPQPETAEEESQTDVTVDNLAELEDDFQLFSTVVARRRHDSSGSTQVRNCLSLDLDKRFSILSAGSGYYSDRSSDTSVLTLFQEGWSVENQACSVSDKNLDSELSEKFRQRCNLLPEDARTKRKNVLSKISLKNSLAFATPGSRHSTEGYKADSKGKLTVIYIVS